MASDSFVGEGLTLSPYKEVLAEYEAALDELRDLEFELLETRKERDHAFETWRAFHVDTLAAFIKNEHEPLKLQNEMLRAQVQAYREDLHREVDAHCVTIQTLHERDKRVEAEHNLAEANARWSDHYRAQVTREAARADANAKLLTQCQEKIIPELHAENERLRAALQAVCDVLQDSETEPSILQAVRMHSIAHAALAP